MPLQPVAVNDAFRNVTIGGTTVAAEQVGDTLTFQAGINIVFTADAGSDTITIDAGAAAGNVSANPDSTNTSRYLIFTAGTSGNQVVYADSDISYNPSTNILTAGSFSGGLSASDLSGTIPSSVLTNSTVYIGTTAIGLDRTSGVQTLTGVSIDGNAGTATTAGSATSAGTATKASNLVGGNNTTLLGSLPYQSNTDTTSLLSPNTTTTKKFLRMTGDGTNGAAPAWDTIVAGDVPTLNQNTTGTASGLSGSQVANYFYAGPTTGPAAPASWRALVASDIPTVNIATNLAGGNNTTLLGSLPYQSNTNTTTLLSPNTTTTKKFLRMTGDGTNGAAPTWDTVTASDAGLGTTSTPEFSSLGVGTAASGVAGEIRATNEITAYYTSDVALKENIETIDRALEKLQKITGVMFDWREEVILQRGGIDGFFVRKRDTGIIAQDVEQVLPEIVGTRPDGTKGVKYEKLAGLIIEAIKELHDQVKDLRKNKL